MSVAIDASTNTDDVVAAVRTWVHDNVPVAWREAGERGGAAAIRAVRTRDEYVQWYPVFGSSGLVAPTWPAEYGGLGVSIDVARAIEGERAPYNLGRLNPLGLNLCAPALFAHGTDEQRLRFLPPIVRNEERWCQLFSEPGAGSDLASLATRAERDGDEWLVSGQKVWTTWAHQSEYAVLLARTDASVSKRKGITYFLLELDQTGVDIRSLRHITGEADFNEVFLDGARVPDTQRVGDVGDGWRVANATLSSERQMVAGAGSGGVDRIGGLGVEHALDLLVKRGLAAEPVLRQRLVQMYVEERIRGWTNERARAGRAAGRPPGPESSVGKIHSGEVNQRLQVLATDLLGADAMAWESDADDYDASLPHEVHGMLRSRANTIEGGTSEVNRNIVGERVLGLPHEPDPWKDSPWGDVPPLMSYERLKVERHGPVGWIIFDRPDAGNAMDAVMFDELERAWLELDADPSVRVIVNTGEGRAFQTGVDVAQVAKDRDALREHSRRTRDATLRFTAWHCQVWKPVIAAVNGVCAGGGLHFVADADIVIAASNATFLDPHVSVGQVVAYEGIALVRKSPMEPIVRMALVGRHERIDAARAHQLGIISEVIDPPDALREHAQVLAEKIARNSPAAMAATKRALWGALEHGLTDACRAGATQLVSMWGHPDQEEGPLAFAEKREAAWVTSESIEA